MSPDASLSAASVVPLQPLLGAVFDSLPSGLVVFDRQLGILLRNRTAELLLPPAKNAADLLARLTVDGACVDWPTELRAIMQSPHSRHFDALAARAQGQPEVCLQLVMSPLRDGSSEVVGGLLVADDVTARIDMDRRLAISERMASVGKLAARVAHELNNPLDGILRFTNLALRRVGAIGDGDTNRYLENVKSGVTRMAQILGSLLEFSRMAPGANEQATINRISDDALAAMEGRIREGNVTVVCNYHGADLPMMRGSSMFQVLCNLIKNAIDAMPEGGTLWVATRVIDQDLVVMVEDTGIGLPEDIEKVFEPFFTTKSEGKGTGLGLAVCRDLIERLGGTITAGRRKPKGTTVVVRVPRQSCTPAKRGD
ncbi:MAG TPA: ATP-binding protein [Phycisphaerae bacterium]|nr:ATP-binding protein [Phycisphaerae bacterium]